MSKPLSEQMQKLAARYENATGKKFGERTNADRIRAMTDEELAEFIATTFENGRISVFAIYPELTENHCGLDWLQQPSGEEDKHETD